MFSKNKIVSSLAGLWLLLALTSNSALAKVEMPASSEIAQFPKLEQPLSLKLIVTLGGLSLIGTELWWFVFSKR